MIEKTQRTSCDEWIHKIRYVLRMKIYSAIQINQWLKDATKWMAQIIQKPFIVSEIRQAQKDKYCIILSLKVHRIS